MFRWTEMQCSPVFSGNFTASGHTVKVTSGHKVAKIEGFTFVVRMAFFPPFWLHFVKNLCILKMVYESICPT